MGGIFTLIPIVVVLTMAVLTRKTASSLIVGIVTAYIVHSGTGFLWTLYDGIYAVGMASGTVWILVMMVFIGAMLGLTAEMGVSQAIIAFIQKRIDSQKGLFIWSWILIVVLFIDDGIRTMVLGQLSPLYDKYKVPRASLAYLADSTATGLASVIPLTSWAAFYMGLFSGFEGFTDKTPFAMYVEVIPFMFYSWASILIVFLFTFGKFPKLGPMKTSYKRLAEFGELYTEKSKRFNETEAAQVNPETVVDKGAHKIICFLVMIAVLTIVVIIYQDLVIGLMIAVAILAIWALLARFSTWEKLMRASLEGAASMMIIVIIIFCAYSMREAFTVLGLPDFVVEVVEPFVSPAMFPFISFIAVCFLSFTTGSNWGVPAVYATIGVPLAMSIGANRLMTMAAIINGATFGGHVCFYADYTVYASALTKIDNMEHALTQFPYGLVGAAIAGLLFLGFGIAM